jgi:hypothetical protein
MLKLFLGVHVLVYELQKQPYSIRNPKIKHYVLRRSLRQPHR